jgi:threonine dehydratase
MEMAGGYDDEGDSVLGPEAFQAAYRAVRRVFPPTPLVESVSLSQMLGRPVWLKLETVTPIRAFKVRGALAKAAELEAKGRLGGLVTASAGNHGLAVAFVGRRVGRPVTVFVPAQANPVKVAAIRALGATIVPGGKTYAELAAAAIPYAERSGGVWIHPFDDPTVIAGQGTVGLEIAEALPDVAQVVVPIGGGGLASGIALALRHFAPAARLVGVQMAGADAMIRSVAAGEVVTLERVETAADGLAPGTVSRRTLAIVGTHAEHLVRLDDRQLFTAMRFMLERERVLAEPSGAAAVAALLAAQVEGTGPVVAVVTGANVTMAHLQQVLNTPPPGEAEGESRAGS